MRRVMGCLLVLVLVAAPACSGDDGPRSDALPKEEELRAGVLTIEDFPARWAVVPPDDEEATPMCNAYIADVLDVPRDSLPDHEVVFARNANIGPAFGETIGFVPEGRGADALAGLAAKVDDCPEVYDGSPTQATRLSYPSVGDESVAFRVHLGDEEANFDVDLVYARVGDLLLVMFAIDVLGNPTDVLDEYVPQAIERARTLAS